MGGRWNNCRVSFLTHNLRRGLCPRLMTTSPATTGRAHPAEGKIQTQENIRGRRVPSALSRSAGSEIGKRGKLFERSEFLPRRFQRSSNGVVSAARLPFLLVLFFGQAKKRMPLPQGDEWWG